MYNHTRLALLVAAFIAGLAGLAQAQTPSPAPAPAATPPLFAATKVEGTENVYIFRYQNHQSMFVVTPAGVIVTDPISYGRPEAAKAYLDEVRKITKAPIKYLVYSHHHYDHIAGGKPFKDAGAVVVAHRRAKERLATLNPSIVVMPDQVVDQRRVIKLGGTTLELIYTGRNHSDSSLVMFLPKEKILFAVDFNSLGAVPSRLAVNDSYPGEWEASLKRTLALGWERQIPGHPGPGGRLGTRKDMEQQLAFMTDLSAEVKKAADAGKCFDPATKEVRVPQHATLQNYEQNIEWHTHRWCGYWGRGI
ncbi:MBL fold metallo-hydrolase [Bradyrhizobium sp.]|uniref:MBL fold metallo-hydrolase n=1 Tax=Bradyrhizobium sp. TaxID=376 RepID=UPI0025B8DE11|nr:MBL fold metallo-hydrolase [Bradyrhizobium sp.]